MEKENTEINAKCIKNKLVTQMRAFCKKTGFTDVTFGLSGGLDSAVVLAVACEALGPEHVHTLMMKTKYTSDESLYLAAKIAKVNGVEHRTIDIQPVVDFTMASLDFDPKVKTVEENIQARVRGVIGMAYSNEKGWMLLSCGNKSEAAMGYCTMYGDMCGSLSPIGDLYKTEVYALADLYNKEGKFTIPEGIINRAPSAELSNNQKDEDSLPPYPILDGILQRYVYAKNTYNGDYDQDTVEWTQRQFSKTAFKRQQGAPTITINDDERKIVLKKTGRNER